MFLDASVIIALLAREADEKEITQSLSLATEQIYVSPMVRFEATLGLAQAKARMVVKDTKPYPEMLKRAQIAVDALLEDIGAQDIAISSDIGNLAIEAASRFGKAVGHKADLNFGDCFAYACAKKQKAKLLFKGNDFVHTDVNDGVG